MIVIMHSLLVLIMFSFLFSFPFHYLLCFNLDIFFMFAIIRMIGLLVHKHIFINSVFISFPPRYQPPTSPFLIFLFSIMDITLTERIHNAVPIIVPLMCNNPLLLQYPIEAPKQRFNDNNHHPSIFNLPYRFVQSSRMFALRAT